MFHFSYLLVRLIQLELMKMKTTKFDNSRKFENLIAKCEVCIKLLFNDTCFLLKLPYVIAYLQLPNTEKNPFLLPETYTNQVVARIKSTGNVYI